MSTDNLQNQALEDELMSAFLEDSVESTVVKAEDIEFENSGIDYSAIFFEPQPGKTYTIKFVKNGNQPNLVHRKIYKNLPHPERRGKTFQYVSSNNSNTCKPLELFFDLNTKKKEGDILADKKIEKYLSQTNQGCSIVQIVSSNDEEVQLGSFRLFSFSTFGPNATIANLVNEKVNPSKEKLDAGFEKEDIWNIFDSSLLMIVCTKSTYGEGREGRDFSKSAWAPKRMGVTVQMDDNSSFQFKPEHKTANGMAPQAIPAFKKLITILQDPNLSIHNYFAYKQIGDKRNTEDTEKYLEKVNEMVDKIIPVIRDAKSLAEIENFCKPDNSSSSTSDSGSKPENILATSIPDELAGSIMDSPEVQTQSQAAEQTSTETKVDASTEAMDMLNEMGGN